MSLTQANVAALFKETYRDAVPEMFAMWDSFAARIKARADVEKFGPRSLRIPLQMTPAGQFRIFSPDGGDMGLGQGGTYDAASITPLAVLEAVQWNKSAEWYTANDTIAVKNATSKLMADAMTEFVNNMDAQLMTAGDGVVATMSSGTGTLIYVLATPFGSSLIRPGNKYTMYDSTLATQRTGLFTCLSNNLATNTITIDVEPTGAQNTDVILVEGYTGANPTGFYGLAYAANDAATGSFYGLSHATYPNLRTPSVTASSALTPAQIRLARNKVIQARGDAVYKTGSWEWFMHPAQMAAYEDLGISMSIFEKGGADDTFDKMFAIDQLKMDGVRCLTSYHANNTRIDLIDWKNWGKGETLPVGLYDVDDETLFPIYGASGGLAAACIAYVANICQFFVDDQQRGVYIKSLTVPTGY